MKRRDFIIGSGVGLITAPAIIRPRAAFALSPQQRVVLFSGIRPNADYNFTTMTALPSYAVFGRTSPVWDFNSQGILTQFNSGVPRLGVYRYDPVAGAWFNAGIDIEQQHQNLITTSAGGFAGANWTKGTAADAITDNNVLSPGGANTGSTFADSSTNSTHTLTSATLTPTSGNTYAYSIFAKAGTGHLLQLTFSAGGFSGVGFANFDLNAGTVTTGGTVVAANIIPWGNGWYRCWVAETATATTAVTADIVLINSTGAGRLPSYAGTGTTILIWQADVIAASLPLTPIPTTSGSVTVNAETLSIPLSSIGIPGSPTGLTMLAKAMTQAAASAGANSNIAQIDDGSTSNRVMLRREATTNQPLRFTLAGGSGSASTIYSSPAANTSLQMWAAMAASNVSAQVIGQTEQTATPATLPSGLTTLRIGADLSAASQWNSTISRLVLYNSRLPDSVAAQKASGL